ncbi:MAG: aspartate 1-decarboxylase [Sulfobacillus benefaciens]|uniref:Aspartate 1-decarboxylase n=1 Tax=Sulfobacillus benefaciens TaxID=453960 RepID=A0A2T2XGR1_9FIRM|nr:MAG: aspartate 1-decarboxylase [Sulfobacillus benefaciens]
MQRQMLKSKIHRAVVTEAKLDYIGSLTLGHTLAEAADILDSEFVHITNINTGIHWVTYVIVDSDQGDTVCLNGTAARNFHPGDPVIIMAYGYYTPEEITHLRPRIVLVDNHNRINQVITKEPPRFTASN